MISDIISPQAKHFADNAQTVLRGHTLFNLPLREHPYSGEAGQKKMKLLRLFER